MNKQNSTNAPNLVLNYQAPLGLDEGANQQPTRREVVMSAVPVLLVTPNQSDQFALAVADTDLDVDIASSLIGGIRKAKTTSFDVAVIDLDSDTNGSYYDFARVLRALPGNGRLPLVFICDYHKMCSELVYAGCSELLTRPLTPESLSSAVHRAIWERADHMPRLFCVDDDEHVGLQKLEYSIGQCIFGGDPVGVAVIAVDRLDEFDIKQGPSSRDKVLAKLGKTLSVRFRAKDVRGRWADNQFVVLLPGETAQATKETMDYLMREWKNIWFVGARGQSFRTLLTICTGEISRSDPYLQQAIAAVTQNRGS